jgi:DNA-binding NtrC family response regulator
MEYKGKILIVDDEEDILLVFKDILEEEGYFVEIANKPEEALEKLKINVFDLVLSDMRMPKMTGEEFLEKLREFNKFTSFIVMTAYGTINNAVECMKKGAFHYIQKPIDFNDPKVWKIIDEAIQKSKLIQENLKLKDEIQKVKEKTEIDYIITQNSKMLELINQVKKIAPFDFTVLITGESGTGKELFARAIHDLSPRKDQKFVSINCANISPDIMEAEFFGYKKGTFTGANEDRPGIFESADKGTVFLDEIGEIPLNLQSKLLRFLQDKEVRRIGETTSKKVDVRIIAATNKDLKQLVKEGKFREDLYFRLETFKINIPPLRERKEDIPLLISHFINQFNRKFGKNIKGITPEALEILVNYNWQGNVRQLINVINQMCIFAEDYIDLEHIPSELKNNLETTFFLDYNKAKQKHQKQFMTTYLKILLTISEGNISKAARYANMERQSLQKLLKKYNVDPSQFRKN